MAKVEETKVAEVEPKQSALVKVGIAVLKSFRGLICETKDGGWELSKGAVAFWVVLGHCMFVWNKIGSTVAQAAQEGITAATTMVTKMDVSDGELYTLWALLSYAGVKIGADTVKEAVATWKGAKG